MSVLKRVKKRAQRRAMRVRNQIRRHSGLPRVSVFRSLKHIYAQIIDDSTQATMVSSSSLELKEAVGDKKAIARSVGLALAERAIEKGIKQAVIDRGPYKYHGRVQALADGLREGGLTV